MALTSAWLFVACTERSDECAYQDCVAYCGGPVVAQAECSECPAGLLTKYPRKECVEDCLATESVMTDCQFCPTGMFERWRCPECETGTALVCVEHCGGEILDVVCDSCEGLVDRSTCQDAGADGG